MGKLTERSFEEMNKVKKTIFTALTAFAAISLFNAGAFAAGFSWPTLYDMDTEGYPLENMANVCNETGHENTGYFPDPTNADNSVLGTRKCA